MKGMHLLAAATVALVGLAVTPKLAQAQETGLASIHTWVRVGGKMCLATHTHDGTGSGKTKKDAERAAIVNWEAFTEWEYGASWGRYGNSASKVVNCDKSTASEFSCHVNSRPCKSSRIAKGRKK